MKATEVLMEEHAVIEQVLNTLDRAIDGVAQGAPVRPGLFLDAADFIGGFADGCHHKKEEEVLFKAMASNGVMVEQGPIGTMLSEHEQARLYTRQMRAAAERLQAGDQSARQDLITNTRAYTSLLRTHIVEENSVLFPMADQAIPTTEYDRVWEGFEQVEHEETGEGVHEKFLAMAHSMAQEVAELDAARS